MLDRAQIADAAKRIRGHLRRTPIQLVDVGDEWLPYGGCLKLELVQHTGTFKPRGAFNRILSAQERGELDPEAGIVVASGGNAGLANAFAARAVGVPATVFVPTTSSPTKVRRLQEYGATVVARGTQYADAYDAAMDHVAGTGAVYCHAYDQPEVCAGAGTLGLELLEQLAAEGRDVDTVLVAVGGGGLMAGVATAVEGRARVVGVEPTGAPTLHAALQAGTPVDVDVSGVASDSLGARRLGSIAWEVAQRTGVVSVLVDDAALLAARRQVWERYRLVVETGAAAPMAALSAGAYEPADGERVAVVLCGANTDPSDLG
ncbi:MAG TPA: threonine/serine dehydratase [Nocardioides sp.]|nr:threonine/serine dehydratase [Nocardioides sp.]